MKNIGKNLRNNQVGVILTDTIYGIVGLAREKEVVDRIYKIKERDKSKSFIVLISSIDELKDFGVVITKEQEKILNEFWPGPTSVILNEMAFRLPKKDDLVELIREVGPIIATSCNKQGEVPVDSIEKAREIFGNLIDFYIDAGVCYKKPSILVKLVNEDIYILRGNICLKE